MLSFSNEDLRSKRANHFPEDVSISGRIYDVNSGALTPVEGAVA